MPTEIDNHQDEEERDDDFEEFIEDEVPVPVKVQKPMDEVMDAQGSYKTALRQSLGSGSVGDREVNISAGTGGTVRVEFDDGPTVWYEMDALVAAAVDASTEAGYLEELDDDDAETGEEGDEA